MRTIQASLLAVIFLAPSTTLAAIDGIRAIFSTDHAQTIPALPVALRVTMTNETANTLRVPTAIALHVIPAQGEPFIALIGRTPTMPYVSSWATEYDENAFELSPHTTRTFEIPAHENAFFCDERLTRPGRYRLELIIADQLPSFPDAEIMLDVNRRRTLITNAVNLTVTPPEGEDAAVWKWMQQTAGKDTWGSIEWARYSAQLEEEVFTHHIKSQYAPFLLFRRSPAVTPKRLQEVIALHSKGAFADWIAYASAASHAQLAREQLAKPADDRDGTRAIREAEESERIFNGLRQSTSNELIKFMLDTNREFMPTAAEVRKAIAERE